MVNNTQWPLKRKCSHTHQRYKNPKNEEQKSLQK